MPIYYISFPEKPQDYMEKIRLFSQVKHNSLLNYYYSNIKFYDLIVGVQILVLVGYQMELEEKQLTFCGIRFSVKRCQQEMQG